MNNHKSFYDSIRATLFGGKISEDQFKGIDTILNEYDHMKPFDLRSLAYSFGTVYHETAKTMQPIEEYGKGKGYRYGRKIKMSGQPYTSPDKIYYGRGFVQLTWYENYERMGERLGIDLLNQPELALNIQVSTAILFDGMANGLFTGRKLSDFFTKSKTDWINARKIVNGTDRAQLIARYSKLFYNALILE